MRTDHKLHLMAGVLVFFITYHYSLALITMPDNYHVAVSFMVAFTIGALKELKDYVFKNGTPEWSDFLYTVLGGGLGVLLLIGANSLT